MTNRPKSENAFIVRPGFSKKIWDNIDSYIGPIQSVRRINENDWFVLQQPLLIWMANTPEGRDLLQIDHKYGPVTKVGKSGVTTINKVRPIRGLRNTVLVEYKHDSRIGAKWANIIRYKWKEFQELAQEYYQVSYEFMRVPIFPVALPSFVRACYLTSTTFPDPDPETTTVDGVLQKAGTDTWANQRGATASNTVIDNTTGERHVRVVFNAGSSCINIDRSMYLFDTSGIGSGSNISAATLSLWITESFNNFTTDPQWNIAGCAPASNTGLVTGDYDVATKWTMTAYSTALNTGGITTGAYTDMTINADGQAVISKTGITKYGAVIEADRSNTNPAEAAKTSRMSAEFAEAVGTANDPKLVVTYAAGVNIANYDNQMNKGGIYSRNVMVEY